MNDLTKVNKNKLIDVLHRGGSNIDIPRPFEREIFLFDTYVAGTTHIENMEEIKNTLYRGKKLLFFREPNNEFDSKAIKIQTETDEKIGYVPKQDNLIFSRLMDAGKILFGRIVQIEFKGKWTKIKIKIFLHEV
ncbi:HIRAN domain-containing protein [Helcococcus kunzii]|uniref:HIRAN domain-containing protein n=1 Tax=Helcococcus kunzii ATCC 51366 TaxID=883114 RepID=H3NQZ5_9FIRM|nr:HIRAN domain-containing protein [Helcococcus kunzii]EHR31943.1 hypothetical protein HMPREF9709_01756 [Helcococcus kunzii ATCC 51366]MCT1796953.1 HIRAN domain-containing protein [Helcococcus kunzii]MCT1988489.1 HIRAN domain-containing protein [Helcococcus kunzii]QUY65665.1 restriction endonuclease [Helcococcus kunzii]QZO76378.1 HIRAN domain-containing protein [Helcococcus kunzii]